VLLDRSRAARPNAALWLVPAAAALVVLLTRDGASILVGGGDGALTAWSAPGLEPEARIAAHRAAVSALALTHRGDTLLTASADGAVRLWQLRAAPHR
jgi:WD40 repeat protein